MYSKTISCVVLFRSRRPRERIYLLFIYRCEDSYEEYQRLALFQELFSFVGSRVPVALSVSPIFSPRNSPLQRSPARLLTTFSATFSRAREFFCYQNFTHKNFSPFLLSKRDAISVFCPIEFLTVPIDVSASVGHLSTNQPNSLSSSLSRSCIRDIRVLFQLSPRSFGTTFYRRNL